MSNLDNLKKMVDHTVKGDEDESDNAYREYVRAKTREIFNQQSNPPQEPDSGDNQD